MAIKVLLNSIHDAAQWCLHVVLIPVIAVLKGADALLQHLIMELGKV